MTEIKVILNRTIPKDDKGQVVQGGARPYQFEMRVGRLVLVSAWHMGTDEKSEALAAQLAKILEDADRVEVQLKGAIDGV